MKTGIRELRSKTKQILSAVQRGETVIISNRGQAYAMIVPIKQKKSKVSEPEAAYGMWNKHSETRNVKEYIKKLREGRHAR